MTLQTLELNMILHTRSIHLSKIIVKSFSSKSLNFTIDLQNIDNNAGLSKKSNACVKSVPSIIDKTCRFI